jgi:hypothetical protein
MRHHSRNQVTQGGASDAGPCNKTCVTTTLIYKVVVVMQLELEINRGDADGQDEA